MASPAPRIASIEGVIDAVKAAIGEAFVQAKEAVGEVSVTVRRESLADATAIWGAMDIVFGEVDR